MYHSNKVIRLLAKSFLLSMGLTLVACGGGGGESSTGVVYTGSTSQADVDDTNTQTFASAIMDGSQDSQDNLNNLAFAVATDDSTSSQNKQYALLSTLVKQVKNNIENNNLESPNLVSAATQSQTVQGTCLGKEGSFTITGTSSSTGANVSIAYSSYCEAASGFEVTLSGSISAVVVITGSEISSMNITIPRLSIIVTDTNTSTTYTNEFSGAISATFTAGVIDSMSVSVNFIENGTVYKISGLSYTQSGPDISISGKIYHPDHGFVNFATTEPFALYNDQLCDGTLEVTGANSNFTITADATCESYTYSGTNKDSVAFSGSFTSL